MNSNLNNKRRKESLIMYYIKGYFEMLNDMFKLVGFETIYNSNITMIEDFNLNAHQNKLCIHSIPQDFMKVCSGYTTLPNSVLANLTCSFCPPQISDYDIKTTLSKMTYVLGLYVRLNSNDNNILYINLLDTFTYLCRLI